MQKILTLNADNFNTGIAASAFDKSSGIFHVARGITPFIEPFPASTNVGLLQTSPVPTDITGAVVVDTPIAAASRITGAYIGNTYLLGDTGHLYSMSLAAGFVVPTDKRSGTPITTPATGLATFQTIGGAGQDALPNLYYFQSTQIGRWDMVGAYPSVSWSDAWSTGLQATTIHPTISIGPRVYFGDKDRIGFIYDNAGTAATILGAVKFTSDWTVTALEYDGTYIIAALTKNLGDSVLQSQTKVIFWDGFSTQWTKEYTINEPNIVGLKRIGDTLYALGTRAIWDFSFKQSPHKGRLIGESSPTGYPNAIDVLNETLLFSGGSNTIWSYGKTIPSAPVAYFQPYTGMTGQPTLIVANHRVGNLLVGTNRPKLYTFSLSMGGTTTLQAETIYLDLGDKFKITQIDVILGTPLVTGDAMTIQTKTDEAASAITYGTLSYASQGAVRKIQLKTGSLITEQLKLIFQFTTGNIKLKRIIVYGTASEADGSGD